MMIDHHHLWKIVSRAAFEWWNIVDYPKLNCGVQVNQLG